MRVVKTASTHPSFRAKKRVRLSRKCIQRLATAAVLTIAFALPPESLKACALNAGPSSPRLAGYNRGTEPAPSTLAVRDAIVASKFAPSLAVSGSGGGVDNIRRLINGEATFAMANAGVVWDAHTGQSGFAGLQVDVRVIAAVYPHSLHVVVRDSSKYRRIEDLQHTRISIGARNSGTEQLARRVLSSALGSAAPFESYSLSLEESVTALMEDRIDVIFFGAAAPVDALAQLARKQRVRFLDTQHLVDPTNRRHGRIYTSGQIQPDTYSGQDAPVNTLDVWDLQVVCRNFPEMDAFRIARSVFALQALNAQRVPAFARATLEGQERASAIALHLGSQRFLAEQGRQPFARLFGYPPVTTMQRNIKTASAVTTPSQTGK